MTRVIAVASGKGGTGKTVITANLGIALAELCKNVVLIDADLAMANLELVLGLEDVSATLQDVLAGEAKVDDVIYTSWAGVKVIPAGISFEKLKMADPDLIMDVVAKLKDKAEFILIDCPPGLCRITLIALESAEELMLVVTPEMSAVADALKTKVIAEKLNTKLMGVVINRWTKSGFKIDKREIEKMLGEVIAVVPEDSEVMKSVSLGQPFVLKSPKSPASKAIKELASKIAGVEIKPEEKKKKGRFRLFRR